jgi:hypothetical protein
MLWNSWPPTFSGALVTFSPRIGKQFSFWAMDSTFQGLNATFEELRAYVIGTSEKVVDDDDAI